MVQTWTTEISAGEIDPIERELLTKCSLLLDIETTGFTPKYQTIYLIGCAYLNHDEVVIRQFFAERPTDEEELLLSFSTFLQSFKTIITFNGERFDLPFLNARATHYHMKLKIDAIKSIDIFRHISDHKKLLNLPAYNQKSIEKFLEIQRIDAMNGGQLIDVYKAYGKNQNPQALTLLKQHNLDDVRGMIPLLTMLRYDHLDKAQIHIDTEELTGHKWAAKGNLSIPLPGFIELLDSWGRIRLENGSLQADFPVTDASLKYFLTTPQLYYYLPDEDMIIPKELGSTIDSSRRRPATKRTCYQKKHGLFLECPKKMDASVQTRLFKDNYDDKTCYAEIPARGREIFLEEWIRQILLTEDSH